MSAFGYRKPADLPQTAPLFPLGGAILLPRGVIALNVFEPRYQNMVDDVLGDHRLIGIVQPAPGQESEASPELCSIGGLGRITAFQETDDGRYLITLTGVCRFELEREFDAGAPYRQAIVSYERFAEDFAPARGEKIDRNALLVILKRYAKLHGFQVDWRSVDEAGTETIVNVAAQICPFDSAAKQVMLEAPTLEERTRALTTLLEWDLAAGGDERPMQ
jgi:Lon protease-like protein